MKLLQNGQARTIYVEGVKYVFVDGVCECEDNKAHEEILKKYNYVVEVASEDKKDDVIKPKKVKEGK